MHTTRTLLAAVAARNNLTTDYQIAKFLQISRQRVSKYQSGEVTLGDDAAILVADALGIERARVLAWMAAERAKSEPARAAWLKLAAGTVAAVYLTVQIALTVQWSVPDPVQSVEQVSQITPDIPYTHLAWLAALLALAACIRSRRGRA